MSEQGVRRTDKADTPFPQAPGYLEYAARETFRDLMRLYGFDQAREIMAEIINSEAGGRYYHG